MNRSGPLAAASTRVEDVPDRAPVRPGLRYCDRGRAAGAGVRRSVSWLFYAILSCSTLGRGLDELFDMPTACSMNFAYDWVFAKPVRKVISNLNHHRPDRVRGRVHRHALAVAGRPRTALQPGRRGPSWSTSTSRLLVTSSSSANSVRPGWSPGISVLRSHRAEVGSCRRWPETPTSLRGRASAALSRWSLGLRLIAVGQFFHAAERARAEVMRPPWAAATREGHRRETGVVADTEAAGRGRWTDGDR